MSSISGMLVLGMVSSGTLGCVSTGCRGTTYMGGQEHVLPGVSAREGWRAATVAMQRVEVLRSICPDRCPTALEREVEIRMRDRAAEIWCEPGDDIVIFQGTARPQKIRGVSRILITMPGSSPGYQSPPSGVRIFWDDSDGADRGPLPVMSGTGPLVQWFEGAHD